MQNVTIQSASFQECFLRLDGRDVKSSKDNGSGIVNCQAFAGPYETLRLSNQPGHGHDVFSIGSTEFPNVYLRMDAKDVKGFNGDGSGTVNCQFGAGPYELFRFETQQDGTRAIASVNFPGAYLRMDGRGVHAADEGSGHVNCQGTVGPYEKFLINVSDDPRTGREPEQAIDSYRPGIRGL